MAHIRDWIMPAGYRRRCIAPQMFGLTLALLGQLAIVEFGGVGAWANGTLQESGSRSDVSLGLLPDEAEIQKQQSILQTRIHSLQRTLESLPDQQIEAWLRTSYHEELAQLQYLGLVYDQYLDLLQLPGDEAGEGASQLESELQRVHDRLTSASQFASFFEVERLRSAEMAQQRRLETVEAEMESNQAHRISLKDQLSEFQRRQRQVREELETLLPDVDRKLQRQLVTLQLNQDICRYSISRSIVEQEHLTRRLTSSQKRLKLIEEMLASCPDDVVLTRQGLDEHLQQYALIEQQLREQLVQSQSHYDALELEFKQDVEADHLASQQRLEMLATWEKFREYHLLRSQYLSNSLQDLLVIKFLWRARFDVMQDAMDSEKRVSIGERLTKLHLRLEAERELIGKQMAEARATQGSLVDRMAEEAAAPPVVNRWLQRELELLNGLALRANQRLSQLQTLEQLASRMQGDLLHTQPTTTAVSLWFQVWNGIEQAWRYEVFVAEDRPITAGKLFSGFLLLLGSWFLSRRISRSVGSRMFSRMGLHEGGNHALQNLLCYLLCLVFGFLTLEWLNIPLTVFAFLGGAAAIGVGFGSQTLLNNFMSGLIVLGERPIRVGDLVEVDGVEGVVQQIGARSTRIRTGDNLEVIVPNSTLMEQRLTNWTLSSNQVRRVVSVGIAYDSPIEAAVEAMQQALRESPRVLNSPEPFVLFSSFGADSLEFELYFWIQIRQLMDGRKVESEVRFEVERRLRERQICIAFPQRDVHLDVQQPVEIRLAESGSIGESNAGLRAAS